MHSAVQGSGSRRGAGRPPPRERRRKRFRVLTPLRDDDETGRSLGSCVARSYGDGRTPIRQPRFSRVNERHGAHGVRACRNDAVGSPVWTRDPAALRSAPYQRRCFTLGYARLDSPRSPRGPRAELSHRARSTKYASDSAAFEPLNHLDAEPPLPRAPPEDHVAAGCASSWHLNFRSS